MDDVVQMLFILQVFSERSFDNRDDATGYQVYEKQHGCSICNQCNQDRLLKSIQLKLIKIVS